MTQFSHSRRNFLKTSAAVTAGAALSHYIISCTREPVPEMMKRPFGKMDFEVSTFGLGGQATIQWVPPDLDPAHRVFRTLFSARYDGYDPQG